MMTPLSAISNWAMDKSMNPTIWTFMGPRSRPKIYYLKKNIACFQIQQKNLEKSRKLKTSIGSERMFYTNWSRKCYRKIDWNHDAWAHLGPTIPWSGSGPEEDDLDLGPFNVVLGLPPRLWRGVECITPPVIESLESWKYEGDIHWYHLAQS